MHICVHPMSRHTQRAHGICTAAQAAETLRDFDLLHIVDHHADALRQHVRVFREDALHGPSRCFTAVRYVVPLTQRSWVGRYSVNICSLKSCIFRQIMSAEDDKCSKSIQAICRRISSQTKMLGCSTTLAAAVMMWKSCSIAKAPRGIGIELLTENVHL